MAEKLPFELVAPEKIIASREGDMVVLPGSDGLIGVLPGHAPIIASCVPGVLEVYEGEKVDARTFVAGGVAQVDHEGRLTVLAEEAYPVDELDRQTIEQAIKTAQEDISDAADDEARAAAENRLKVAKAKLQAVTGELVV